LYRALIFDLDGTLAETDSLHLPTWMDVLRPHGIEVDEESTGITSAAAATRK
jgi:beta-phosphoglucomutase-like phosphatase (HAD superfamily)